MTPRKSKKKYKLKYLIQDAHGWIGKFGRTLDGAKKAAKRFDIEWPESAPHKVIKVKKIRGY